MTAPEALSVQGESTAAAAEPTAAPEPSVASVRFPQLIPIAQLVAVVVGVLAIIWNQQQTTDNLRTELTADINRVETTLTADINRVETTLTADINRVETTLTADINRVETTLTAEINRVETGLDELRAEVADNGARLARIEGFFGIEIPDDPPQ